MNSLKSLKNIVSKLTEEEIKTLKKVLSINIVLKNESKSLNLINLLLSDKNFNISGLQGFAPPALSLQVLTIGMLVQMNS